MKVYKLIGDTWYHFGNFNDTTPSFLCSGSVKGVPVPEEFQHNSKFAVEVIQNFTVSNNSITLVVHEGSIILW